MDPTVETIPAYLVVIIIIGAITMAGFVVWLFFNPLIRQERSEQERPRPLGPLTPLLLRSSDWLQRHRTFMNILNSVATVVLFTLFVNLWVGILAGVLGFLLGWGLERRQRSLSEAEAQFRAPPDTNGH